MPAQTMNLLQISKASDSGPKPPFSGVDVNAVSIIFFLFAFGGWRRSVRTIKS